MYVDIPSFEKFKTQIETSTKELEDKNRTIYLDHVPDLNTLPKFEKKTMVTAKPLPVNY